LLKEFDNFDIATELAAKIELDIFVKEGRVLVLL
jgi:hypothetical protein